MGTEFIDVQPYLLKVCDGMSVGELLHGPNFNLHDAMMAVEIGDPKMDFGMRHDEVPPPEELIAKGAAPVDLSQAQLLALFDKLLIMEASWHHTSLLPQTVFSSLYMLQPDRLKSNTVLHSYCVALRAACTVIYNMIIDAQVCEDEDVSMHIFGFKLDPSGAKPQEAAIRGLLKAEAAVATLITVLKENTAKTTTGADGVPDMDIDHATAMLARLRFRRIMLQLFLRITTSPITAQQHLEDLRKRCDQALAELPKIEETASLAEGAEAPGFVSDINKRHMAMVPPRPVQKLTLSEAVAHWRGILEGIAETYKSLPLQGGWSALSSTLVQFASKAHPPIVRSVMHLALAKPLRPLLPPLGPASGLAQGTGQHEEKEIPPWCPSPQMICDEFHLKVDALPGDDIALFIEQCSIATQAACHALCLNRSRQRRGQKRLLRDWVNMADHAYNAEVSEVFQAHMAKLGWKWTPLDEEGLLLLGPLSAWVQREASSSMLMHLLLGFPTEVYAPHEYTAVYWYSDYLLGAAQQTTHTLFEMLPDPKMSRQQKRATSKGGKGKQGGKGGTGAGMSEEQAQREERKLMLAWNMQIERTMCQGFVKLCRGLEELGVLGPPATAVFNTEQERFEQRFGAFQQIYRPEPLGFEHFVQLRKDKGISAIWYLSMALENFMKAMADITMVTQSPSAKLFRIEQMKHLTGVKRIAAQNMMAVKIFLKALENPKDEDDLKHKAAGFAVSWDFKVSFQHSAVFFYPCLTLKSVGTSSKQ